MNNTKQNYECHQTVPTLVTFDTGDTDAGSLNSPMDDAGQKEDDDDEAGLAVKSGETEGNRPTVAPRWPTRVFAVECLLKIMALCPVSLSDIDPAQLTDPASGGKGQL